MKTNEKRMLRARRVAAIAGGALVMGLAAAGCANDYTCVDYATCPFEAGVDGKVTADGRGDTSKPRPDGGADAKGDGRVGDGGSDGTVGEGGADAPGDVSTCNGTASPKDAPCVISETYGVFVAPAGNGGSDTTGTGSRSAPYATIGKGIASAGGKRVYVCGATYGEALSVTAGVAVFGGLACPVGVDGGGATDAATEAGTGGAWTYTGALAEVVPTAVGFALDVESVSGASFEDMGFTAMDAPSGTPGGSSIAVMVNASMGVGFTRVSATAGVGVAGVSPGAPVTNWCAAAGQIGSGTTSNGGGGGGTCTCGVAMFGGLAESSTGGPGGSATVAGMPAGTSSPPVVGATPPIDGVGGDGTLTAGSGGVCGNGHQGANGAAGSAGGAGAQGSLTATGWVTASAGAGSAGTPGQGGGGGGGNATKGGTGGGAGGCGGNGGAGGGGGEQALQSRLSGAPRRSRA